MVCTPVPIGVLLLCVALTGCSQRDAFERQVERRPIGSDRDQWIEMFNLAGEWERTGLIFGYTADFEECEKAIAGLKAANPAREYRCATAN